MPELPEVEFVRRLLRRTLAGDRIRRATARRPDLRYPLPEALSARLEGQTVTTVTRRAKYLLLELTSRDVLVVHLGMSGWFRVLDDGELPGAHDHVLLELESGATVAFYDPRRFGFMRLIPRGEPLSTVLPPLGPEPLSAGFTAEALCAQLCRRRSPLKTALADQRVVAGLGNIYIVEALHRARLSPRRRVSTLCRRSGTPRAEARALVAAIKHVLKDAIAHDHRVHGSDRFRVYGRDGARCPRRGCSGVIRRSVHAGRSTFFCPVCQR